MCGCQLPDDDGDSDGVLDCLDGCAGDPDKTEPGICGCGVADEDTDDDGTADCLDDCPADPGKTEPQICGCGTPDGQRVLRARRQGPRAEAEKLGVETAEALLRQGADIILRELYQNSQEKGAR